MLCRKTMRRINKLCLALSTNAVFAPVTTPFIESSPYIVADPTESSITPLHLNPNA